MQDLKPEEETTQEEKSFLGIIVHSFFIIPFLIAVFCVLLFAAVNLLTSEKRTVYDYLEDVKTGGLTKRWQGAFELSKIIANSQITNDPKFSTELINAFEHAQHDDDRVRQYLALAMGRTGNLIYVQPLINALKNEKDLNITSVIYALGMLQDKKAADVIYPYLGHVDARIRSIAVVALGNIGNSESIPYLREALKNSEANVQWGAAISLAQMNDNSGRNIILSLLNRNYLSDFSEVDPQEQTNLMLSAISAASFLKDTDLDMAIKELAQNDKNMKVRAAAMKYIQ